MEFTVQFYSSENGRCPIREFLDDLEETDRLDHAAVVKGLNRLADSQSHRRPLCKPIGGGLFELRHLGPLNTRLLWFFMVGRRIIVVHGIRHKAQEILPQDLAVARARREDWLRRDPQ